MIVTASTLMGLTSINGCWEVHLAMLVMLIWKVKVLILPVMPVGVEEEVGKEMSCDTMWNLCAALHAYLAVTCFMSQSPSFNNSVLLQIANFCGLGFTIYTITKVSIELYESQPLAWMDTYDTIVGSVWLNVELATFYGNVMMNIIFMLLRSIK